MKVGIVLDNKVNKWALQRFELLKNELDITVFVGERNDYDVKSIDLNKRYLSHSEEVLLAMREPFALYKRIWKAPHRKMDFYYFSLKRYLEDMDVVYSSDIMRSAYTLASLKEELGFKFILSWWENIPYRSVFDRKTHFMKKIVMEKVDFFLPFTETAREVLRIEGVSADKIEVVYPGVDLERFKPGEKPVKLLERYNVPEGFFVILYVGKIASWKGIHNLVYMAKILKDRGMNAFVIAIAGKGAQKENMERLIKEMEVTQHFRFLDFVSYNEMPEVYRMADAFVLPSYPTMTWQEQFGMVLVEAMASGKPVVSTLSGSIPEVVGDAAILIPAGDYKGLADAVIKLREDESFREGLVQKGRERAKNLFCNKKVAQELSNVLGSIACT